MRTGNVALCALLLLPAPASAHRLDEYLQAAILDFGKDSLTLELRLTPGTSVAARVIRGIDTDRNNSFSQAERDAYAARVQSDLTLTIDGAPRTLRLMRAAFPPLAGLRGGTDGILLAFTTPLPQGARTLTLENRHLPALSVYLANSLVPRDPQIRITGQSRNLTQSRYTVQWAAAAVK